MMRPLPSLRLVIGAVAASLLLVPAAAAAATGVLPSDAEAPETETPETETPETETPETETPDAATRCDDHLVTFTREATTGDDRAVAITAQLIEQGAHGWEMVGWQAAAGTELREVLATDRQGEVNHLGTAATGVAEQVTALTFCGTSDAPAEVDAGQDHVDEDAEVVIDPPSDAADPEDDGNGTDEEAPSEPDAEQRTAGGSTTSTTEQDEAAGAAPAPLTAPSSGTGTAGADTAASSTPGAGTAAPPAAGDATSEEAEEAEEAEVLGVRIVATPEVEDEVEDDATDDVTALRDVDDGTTDGVGSQPALAATELGTHRGLLDSAWLLAAAIAAGIAAGASVIRFRSTAAADAGAVTAGNHRIQTGSTGQHGENHR